jgi:hypothetical protein
MAAARARGDCQLLVCRLLICPPRKQTRQSDVWAGRQPDVMLPVFCLSSRFLDNPISSNIRLVTALINRGGPPY